MSRSIAFKHERRADSLGFRENWDSLTVDQKLGFYQLQGWGYRLLFVRKLSSGPLAVIAQDDDIATLDAEGELNTRPNITLRFQ